MLPGAGSASEARFSDGACLGARARGAGLGRALLEQLFEELRVREVPGVHMGVEDRNTNAVGFYEHLGFRTLEHDIARNAGERMP